MSDRIESNIPPETVKIPPEEPPRAADPPPRQTATADEAYRATIDAVSAALLRYQAARLAAEAEEDDEDEDEAFGWSPAPQPAEEPQEEPPKASEADGTEPDDGAEAPPSADTGPDIPSFARRPGDALTDEEEPEGEEAGEEEEEPAEEEEPPAGRVSRLRTALSPLAQRIVVPLQHLLATRLARTMMQKAEAANWPDPVDIRETPELTPKKAGKYYNSLLRFLRLRLRAAIVLTLILVWISLGLPLTGMLRASVSLQAGVCVALTLAVTMTALDVFTAGLRQLVDLRPGAETLAALAVILSCVDGVLTLTRGGSDLPFCAIGAAAMTSALWGQRLSCVALRRSFRTAAQSKNPSVLSADRRNRSDQKLLSRSTRGTTEGAVRRSESQDLCQTYYAAAAPFLLGAALLLSVLASLGQFDHFLHTLSALVSVCASFAAFFSFPLPYAIASRRLRPVGVALAGWDGCQEIGRTRRIVITDEDLFPPGTMRFSEINVQEGVFLGKVVSSTASLIAASGSGVSALFDELVARRGYHVPGVVDFVCHEGGGLSGLIGGERILVGSAGFMNLMGIRLPQNLQIRNAICTAISGELVGVFVIEYIPVSSVQEALVTLMRGRIETIFAIRDFNITPYMIGELFRIPTDSFNFPSFRERYSIGGEAPDDTAPPDAVITRSGMLPLVEAAETGRRVYTTCRISTILSLIGAVIGMVIMFLLCRAGTFDTANVGNVLSFMFLWTLPVIILSVGQIRQ